MKLNKTIFTQNVEETRQLGELLGRLAKAGMIFTLTGDLGAGKTTLTQGIAKGMGITRTVSSPTFTILKIYQGTIPLYHFDAYRLEGAHQELGFEEMIEGDGLAVIEWPEFIENLQQYSPLKLTLRRLSEDQREITMEGQESTYQEIWEALA